MATIPEPRLDRDITVQMMGDWGIANLHRICGWLAAEMGARAGPGSRFATWNGRGGTDAIAAVLDGTVDASLFVPAPFARTVVEGQGIYDGPGAERLRAIATLPQDDRLVIAVDSKYGIASLDDLRRAKPPLTMAVAMDDGCNMVGYATNRLLDAAGLSRATIEGWGGSFVEGEAPWDTIGLAIDGTADAVIFEAIMTPFWTRLQDRREMTFVPIDDDVLDALEAQYSWPRGSVPQSRFKGLAGSFQTLDFSDFLLLCRDDLDDEIAYLMTWCACETTATIESQYKHLAPEDSPLTYPLDPAKMARTSVPPHPGARKYYAEKGLL